MTLQFTSKGNKRFHADHAREAVRRARPRSASRSASRSCSTTRSARGPRSTPSQYPDGIDPSGTAPRSRASASPSEAKNLALVLQTGALPVKFVTQSSAPTSRRRSARTRCSQARDAAIGGLIVVALFLLLLYRFLGLVAVIGLGDLRGVHVRRDPALRRDADAAGLRRADPDDRRRGRRERRHLRTHQGRGRAGKSVRAAIATGLREGLPHDHRRERRHRHHRARSCSRSRPRGEGVRADAADRHRGLADHGGRRDARDARTARRLQAGSRTRASWARTSQQGRAALQIDFMRRRYSWFAISGAVVADRRRLARRPRPEPRHRLQGRRAGHVHDAEGRRRSRPCAPRPPRSARKDAVVQGRGKSTERRRVQELPDPPEEAQPAEQAEADQRPEEQASRRRSSASRTSRRASAVRSRARRSSRSSSRSSSSRSTSRSGSTASRSRCP